MVEWCSANAGWTLEDIWKAKCMSESVDICWSNNLFSPKGGSVQVPRYTMTIENTVRGHIVSQNKLTRIVLSNLWDLHDIGKYSAKYCNQWKYEVIIAPGHALCRLWIQSLRPVALCWPYELQMRSLQLWKVPNDIDVEAVKLQMKF